MIRKLNQYLFACFLFSLLSSLATALLYSLALSILLFFYPEHVMEGLIFYASTFVAAVSFIAYFCAYMTFVLFRLIRNRGNDALEKHLIPITAALLTNIFVAISFRTETFMILLVSNLLVSLLAILVSERIYVRIQKRLMKLQI